MQDKPFADSVFSPRAPQPARGLSLRVLAVAWVALAIAPAALLAALAWRSAPAVAHELPLGLLASSVGAALVSHAFLVAWLGLRWLLHPMRDLAEAMRQIEAGGWPGLKQRVAGVRELQELQRGLQLMWDGLERRRRERDAALAESQAVQEQLRHSMRELAERERRYRELFEANPNVMWIYDVRDLRFLAVNDAAVARYGYTREQFLSMRVTEIRPPEDRQRLLEALQQEQAMAFLGDTPRIWRHRTREGRTVLAEVAHHPIVFQGCAARVALVTDVTARLAAESRLRQGHLQLSAELAEARQQLAVAQRLVEGVGSMLDAPAAEAALAPATQVVLRRAQRLLELQRMPAADVLVDLTALAQREISLLRLRDPHRRVHVEIEPALYARGDTALLSELLRELLGNAWDSTRERPQPWLRMGRVDGATGRYFISDNGSGFDAAEQARLFLPFESQSGPSEAAGLGLALAVALIRTHGGRLWAESRPGKGSTFFFELGPPVPQAHEAAVVQEVVIDSAWPQA